MELMAGTILGDCRDFVRWVVPEEVCYWGVLGLLDLQFFSLSLLPGLGGKHLSSPTLLLPLIVLPKCMGPSNHGPDSLKLYQET